MCFRKFQDSILLVLALLGSGICGHAAADEPPRQSWGEVAKYPGRGLSPLYDESVTRIDEVIKAKNRWSVLPRPVTSVMTTPGATVYSMQSGDSYYRGLRENREASQWSARHTQSRGFRLLSDLVPLAVHKNQLWVSNARNRDTRFFVDGDQWRTIPSFGPATGPSVFVPGRQHWWIVEDSDLLRFTNGGLKRERIPSWKGSFAGISTNQSCGRSGNDDAVVWSHLNEAQIAFHRKGKWITQGMPSRVTVAKLRPDGSALVFGKRLFLIVPNPHEPEAAPPTSLFHLGEEFGLMAAGNDGSAILLVNGRSGMALGLVFVPSNGPAHWVSVATNHRETIIWNPDWSERNVKVMAGASATYYVHIPDEGLFLLHKSNSSRLTRIMNPKEITSNDKYVAVDREGAIYLQRPMPYQEKAMLRFLPNGNPIASSDVTFIANLRKASAQSRNMEHSLSAVLDSAGVPVWIDEDSHVQSINAAGEIKTLVESTKGSFKNIWRGEERAVFVETERGELLAVAPGKKPCALFENVNEFVREFLSSCPQSSRDARRTFARSRAHLPVVRVGNSLWMCDQGKVQRVREVSHKIDRDVEVVLGGYFPIGPLRDGELLLVPRDSRRRGYVPSWLRVVNPDGDYEIEKVAAPSSRQAGSRLERPEFVGHNWHLDQLGWLWLSQGFDRVYRISSTAKWEMLGEFGSDFFEYPRGAIWAFRNARVFRGHEIGGSLPRQSCKYSYVEHFVPLAAQENTVYGLSPLGISILDVSESAEDAQLIASIRIDWPGTPVGSIGISNGKLLVIVDDLKHSKLVSVALDDITL